MSKRVPQTLSPRQGWREGSEDFTVRRGRRPPRQRDPHAEEEMSNSQKGLPNAKSEEAPQGPPKHKGGAGPTPMQNWRKCCQLLPGSPKTKFEHTTHPHAKSEEKPQGIPNNNGEAQGPPPCGIGGAPPQGAPTPGAAHSPAPCRGGGTQYAKKGAQDEKGQNGWRRNTLD